MQSDNRMRLINGGIWALLLLAAGVSATHIIEAAHKLGVDGWQAWIAPALIDFVAIVGKLSMHATFTQDFQRSGFRLLMVGGALSLTCNVYAGGNIGERAFGVLVVGAFLLLEHHATKAGKTAIAPPAEPTVDELLKAKRSEAAKRGVETKRRNAATKTRKPRAPKAARTKTPVEEIEELDDVAPVSAAPATSGS